MLRCTNPDMRRATSLKTHKGNIFLAVTFCKTNQPINPATNEALLICYCNFFSFKFYLQPLLRPCLCLPSKLMVGQLRSLAAAPISMEPLQPSNTIAPRSQNFAFTYPPTECLYLRRKIRLQRNTRKKTTTFMYLKFCTRIHILLRKFNLRPRGFGYLFTYK